MSTTNSLKIVMINVFIGCPYSSSQKTEDLGELPLIEPVEPPLTFAWDYLTFDKQCQVNTIPTSFTDASRPPTIVDVLTSDLSILSCTGLSSMTAFDKICEAVEYVTTTLSVSSHWRLDVRSRLLLTFMKLKLNLSFRSLSCFFRISERSAADVFFYMIDVLYTVLKQFVPWPSKDIIEKNLPVYFAIFSDTRLVLDCAETPVQKSNCLNCSIRTYSHYKGKHTIKFALGTSPSGLITFVSDVYGGRASDKYIINNSKILKKCQMNDAIMVDKGFAIEQECEEENVQLYRPPFFYKKNKQFTPEEVRKCRLIARARVHVERVIQRIRIFKILNEQIHWSLLESIDKILTIICAIVNLSPPILSDKRFLTV